jgi:hypothetical protein
MKVRRPRHAIPLLLVFAAFAVTGTTGASPPPPTDRSIKLDLISKLKESPKILILGDSRGREAEPAYLRRLTGHSGFNGTVMGGSTPDFWVFTRYTADRFPNQKHRYIWFVSAGLMSYIVDPRLEADPRGKHYLQEVTPYLSGQTDTVSWPAHVFNGYRPDGSVPGKASRPSARHVRQVKAEAAALVTQIRQHPPTTPRLDPNRSRLFEHLLAYVNARGEKPVIVINPRYPTVYAELKRYGNPLTTSSLNYLRALRARYDFVVVNCEDIHTWGGTDTDWVNPTHVNRTNMRRMLRYIVAHSNGALH